MGYLESEGVAIMGGLYRWILGSVWPNENNAGYIHVYFAEDMEMRERTLDKMRSGLGRIRNKICKGIAQCEKPDIRSATAVTENT